LPHCGLIGSRLAGIESMLPRRLSEAFELPSGDSAENVTFAQLSRSITLTSMPGRGRPTVPSRTPYVPC